MRCHRRRRAYGGINVLYSPESPTLLVISVTSNSTGFLPVRDDLWMLVHGTVLFDFKWFYLLALD